MCLSFTIAADCCQRSHCWVRFPRDSWPCFAVSVSRLPQLGEPGLHIYISQEHCGQLYPQALGSLSSAPTTPRATVEVFEPASTRANSLITLKSKSHCDWRSVSESVSLSLCRGAHHQILVSVWQLLSSRCGEPSLTTGWVCPLSESQSAVINQLSVCTNYLHFTCY
jgi:hypothetical protein